MARQLPIAFGQYSDRGRKAINQDFHAVKVPLEPQLNAKGLVYESVLDDDALSRPGSTGRYARR